MTKKQKTNSHHSRLYHYQNGLTVEGQALKLSPEFSEWLFFFGFWSKVNVKLGTIFDQYEEDVASTEIQIQIIKEFELLRNEISQRQFIEIDFPTEWNQTEEKMKRMTISKCQIVLEIEKTITFIKQAWQNNIEIEFSL